MITKALKSHKKLVNKLLKDEKLIEFFEKTSTTITEALQLGRKVYIIGNGGSATDAMHFAGELTGHYLKNRRSLACEALVDPGIITCIANDYGYDKVFSHQLKGRLFSGDVVILLSTSGNSKNILEAIKFCDEYNALSISLLGKEGGIMKKRALMEYVVPSDETARIQEIHKLILHAWAEHLDEHFE